MVIPAEITIFEDRSFTFVTKTPPDAVPAPAGRGYRKGRGEPPYRQGRERHRHQVRQIAETKMPDLNAVDLDGTLAQVAGTAGSMGIEIVE